MNIVLDILQESISAFGGDSLQYLSSQLIHTILSLPSFFLDSIGFKAQAGAGGGGVGNLVAAALQTKGMVDQAKILSDFKSVLEWIAALAWLFSIGMAVGSVAVFGNYRQGAYLLVGPALFYWMINTTAETDGTRVIVGDRELAGAIDDEKRLLRWISAIGGELDADGNVGETGSADVSFFFAVFDSMVTEMVQKLVSVLIDSANKHDLRMIARERAMSYVLQASPESAPFGALIVRYHLGECGEAMSGLQVVENEKAKSPVKYRTDVDIKTAEEKFKLKWTTPDVGIDPAVKKYLMSLKGSKVPSGGSFEVPFATEEEPWNASCEQIWKWTRDAIFIFAGEKLKPENFKGSFDQDTSGIDWEQAYNDVKKWLEGAPAGGVASNTDALKVLAVYIYKNVVVDSTHSTLQSTVLSRSGFNAAEFDAIFGQLSDAEAHGGYFKLRYFATAIPYIQGLLLYLLSIAFPFFAIYLVLPGKATSFFAWCSLWVWVKSWDVGFALVHVARDIFWHMMNNRVNVNEKTVDWTTPSDVMVVAFNNDPVLTQNSYWILASALTVLVPALTAQLTMGASGMYSAFKYGIDQTAARFGAQEENRARRYHGSKNEVKVRALSNAAMGTYAKAQSRHAMKGAGNPQGASDAMGNPIASNNAAQPFKAGEGNGGSSNSNPHSAAAAWHSGAQRLWTSNHQSRMDDELGVAKAIQQEKDNKKANAENRANGITPGTMVAAKRPDGSLRKDKDGNQVMEPYREAPEQIPNIHRGLLSMHSELDEEAIVGHYGKDSAEHKAWKGAEANKGQRMTWDDFFEKEQAKTYYYADRLAVVTRRKSYSAMIGGGSEATRQLMNQQLAIARFGRGNLDGMESKTVPLMQHFINRYSDGNSRPENPGLSMDGNWFSSSPSGLLSTLFDKGGDSDAFDTGGDLDAE